MNNELKLAWHMVQLELMDLHIHILNHKLNSTYISSSVLWMRYTIIVWHGDIYALICEAAIIIQMNIIVSYITLFMVKNNLEANITSRLFHLSDKKLCANFNKLFPCTSS